MTPATISKSMFNTRYYANIDIEKAEERYDAVYVGEFPGKTKHGWTGDYPVAVFYVANPKAPYTNNYLCLFICSMGTVYIGNADYVKDEVFSGLRQSDGIIYSTYRHDYRGGEGGTFVDGGWDYFRYGFADGTRVEQVRMKIVDGVIMELSPDETT